jgi:hypothetical protein
LLTGRIEFFDSKYLNIARATEALTRNLSTRTDVVMSLAVGISLFNFSKIDLSMQTALFALFFSFPLDHFFFFCFPPVLFGAPSAFP